MESAKAGNTCHIDWLQFTINRTATGDPEQEVVEEFAPILSKDYAHKDLGSVKGYDTGRRISNGSVYWHSKIPSQKIMVVFAGYDLSKMAETGVSQLLLLKRAVIAACRITRLDFAIDLYDTGASPDDLLDEVQAGRARTKAHHATHIAGYTMTDKGVTKAPTVYIGAPQSDRQMRCYDKGLEQRIDRDWKRIELVTRKPLASPLADSMLRNGIDAAGRMAVRSFADFDLDWYQKAIDDVSVEIAPHIEPKHNTRRWLINVVLPVLERESIAEQAEGGHAIGSKIKSLAARLGRKT